MAERRTHAERTAETRARIMQAVVESIGEVGFARTTAAEIVKRSGVTWGAVQHHFGDKAGILLAVVEDSFDDHARRLQGIELEGTPLEKRVSLFIDRSWEHYSSAKYRSTLEILLHWAGSGEEPGEQSWQRAMSHAWDRVWRELFPDTRLSRQERFALEHFTVSALTGFAATRVLEGPDAKIRSSELELLKRTLLQELER